MPSAALSACFAVKPVRAASPGTSEAPVTLINNNDDVRKVLSMTLAHAAGTSWRPHVISLRSASWAGDGNGCKDG